MLNTNVSSNINNQFDYHINAVSGTFRKSHPKSIVTYAQIESLLWKHMFDENKPYIFRGGKDIEIVVLQCMILPNNYCLIEFIKKEDLGEDYETN